MLLARLLLAALLLPLAAACGTAAGSGRPTVVAGFYPLQFLAERLGGPDVRVVGLSSGGAEPHDLELTPRQVGAISTADLVLRLGGFQPALDDAAAAEARGRTLDVADLVPLRPDSEQTGEGPGLDPHVWLDPGLLREVARGTAARMATALPDLAPGIAARAAQLDADLAALDADLRAGLATCARRDLVTSHAAFGYLASAYGLRQVGITGVVPDAEPTPGRLAEVARYAREHDVTTVFTEDTASPRTAQSLAREIGAQVRELSPLETAPATGDYLSALREDLAVLRDALGCA